MRVGLNLLYLIPKIVGGTETYARELIGALARANEDHEYVLFVNEESRHEAFSPAGHVTRVVCPVAASSRRARYLWEQTKLPQVLAAARIDVLHSLGYVGPLKAGRSHVVTIHDANFMQRDVRMSIGRRVTLGITTLGVSRMADRIITMSKFSRRELIQRLRLDPSKVTVTYLAPLSNLATARRPIDPSPNVPYVIAFAGPSVHKNIPRLIMAFATVAASVPHRLRIVGSLPADGTVESAISHSGLASRVDLVGYIDESAMRSDLANATALAFPSLYEGFGLPVVDAQFLGVPVLCGASGSLGEIAGAGALKFNPRSVHEIGDALRRVLLDQDLRHHLVATGFTNVARFSWDRTAQETLATYTEAYRGRRSGVA